MYDAIVLSGGREKGISMLSFLEKLHEKGELDNVKSYAGASVGSIICLLLSIGLTPSEVIKVGMNKNLSEKFPYDNKKSMFENIIDILPKMSEGLIDLDFLTDGVEKIVIEKCGKIMTMKELYEKFNKRLVFSTLNTTREKIVYIDHQNFPNLSCIKAIQMSSCIPGLFKSCIYKEMSYIDGCFGNPLPISPINDGKIKILAILIYSKFRGFGNASIDHYFNIFNVMMKSLSMRSCENLGDNITLIKMELDDKFVVDEKMKKDFYLEGIKYYERFDKK